MGFFSKLFEKKECAICGGEIGLLGNRKLEDGNMCKNCAAKLSPWFSDRRNSTVQEINEQLQYREENQAALRGFRPNRSFGQYYKMFVEEKNGVPVRFVVNRGNDYEEANADLVNFTDVTSCDIDIREHRDELKRRNENNEMVSYNPPRYRYQYDFYVSLTITGNPYFDDMQFKLNRDSVDIESDGRSRRNASGIGQFLGGFGEFDPSFNREYREFEKMCEELKGTVECGQQGIANVEFKDAVISALGNLANQNAAAQKPAPAQEEAPAPRKPKFCPECGAPAGEGKFCEFCGHKLQ